MLFPVILTGLALVLVHSTGGSGMAATPGASPSPGANLVRAVVGGTEGAPMVEQAALVTTGATVTLDGLVAGASAVQPGVVLSGTTIPGGMPLGGPIIMKHIEIQSACVGAVQAVDLTRGRLTVMGHVILVTPRTSLVQDNRGGSATPLGLAGFSEGDYVTVYGLPPSGGGIQATRVERAAPVVETRQRLPWT
jgi:hypothetical protein